MRTIKFRAWNEVRKEMYFSTSEFSIDTDGPTTAFSFWTDGYHPDWSYDEVKLMQFTGLKDKNGKEIYEGDIVEWEDGDRAPVEFRDGAFKTLDLTSPHYGRDTWRSFALLVPTQFEVIGNIYSNPELLKP